MEINPYDNFDDWSCILLNTLQCSQDYVNLLADCTDLMFSIISESQLPEPITSYTYKFLNNVIPEATTSLLRIIQTNDEDIETSIGFLTTSLTLCTWGIQNNIESLFKLPPLILDKYQSFYYHKKENWKTIMDNFLSSGDMNLICDLIMSTDPFPSLNIFLFVAEIILIFFRNNLYDEVTLYVEKFVTAFGNYLRSMMDLQKIRNIDKNILNETFYDFYRILADTSFDHIFDLSSYYEFFEFCIKSDILLVQLFITKSFRHFLLYVKDEIILQFSEWCKSKDLIKFLISKDFNEEVIKQLVPIFELLADKDLLKKNTLYILWNRTLHVHTSLRSSYINLIARILHNMKSKDAKNYLAKIMINGNKDINEIDINKEEEESNDNLDISKESSSFIESQSKILSNNNQNELNTGLTSNNEAQTDLNTKTISNDTDTINTNENQTELNTESISNDITNSNENQTDLNTKTISNDTDTNNNDNQNELNTEPTSNDTKPENNDENDGKNQISDKENNNENSNDDDNQKHKDNIENVSASDGIKEKSTSEETNYNKYNYHYDYMTINRYNEINRELSNINLNFQLTNDLVQLLLGCLTTSKSKVAYYIITVLFEFSKKDEKIANEFQKSIENKWDYKIKLFLFYKCFEQIKESEEGHHIATIILPKLINTVGYNVDLGRDFERRLFESLPYDKPLIYSVISEYYQGNDKFLPLKKIINMYGGYNDLDDEFWSFMKSLLDTNGINATSDGGFDTLKECINHFDFKKATSKFVYFIKSYYLIINLYEDRMKTEDFHKHTIKGKITFIKSNEPPIGLDQLFRLLELTEDDHVALITINTILIFATSYESFKCDDAIDIIKKIILPKIQSKELNPTLIKRYLTVLYDIALSSELYCNLIDYNYPKHSIYKDDIILLEIEGLGVHQNIICEKHDTFIIIQNRLIKVYPYLKEEHIYFRLNGSLVCDENNFLETYNLDKDIQKVTITTYNNAEFDSKKVDKTKAFIPNCPSLLLTRQHFQNLLLSFYDTPELCETVSQFLNFLPNDPETIKLVENQEILVSLLLDGRNSYAYQYYLQVLISILKTTNDYEIISQFKNIDFCTFLCQFLSSHEECSYEIIAILQCLFSIELSPIINDILLITCNVLSADNMNLLNHLLSETKIIASQLFYKILLKFPDVNVFVDNPTLLESVVSHATIYTWISIRNGLFNLSNIMPLFDKLINHIESSSQNNSRYFAELFTAFVPRVSNECNVSKILDMCIDLLTSKGVFDQTNEDSQTLISFCEMTSSILNSNKDIEFNNKDLSTVIEKILPIALNTDDQSKQSAVYDLCLALISHITDGQQKINQIMKSVYEIETDRWNYKPDNFTKSSTGFVGLTNLGATCYMNSVIQQLFFFRPFRDSVLEEKFESEKEGKEAFFEFQKIFAHLLLSKKSYAETRPFCNVWIGWEKKVINVREQQDAVEFLNMFLDQLPKNLQKYYQGTIVNQIEGISEEFKSNNIETFFALSLEIQNFTTIEESFDNFLQNELFTGENQIYADSLERKIDARKYSRIHTAPPALILHLKRFGYDIHTFNRNKIYSRFVIPKEINIKKLLENEEEMIYELKGVVVHFGNANGGHYTSIIKINENFYNFNDMNVSYFNENDFEQETFGGNKMSNCAYLLFYERKESNKLNSEIIKTNLNDNENKSDEKIIDIESESLLISPEIREEIEKENDEFIRCQIAFTKPTMKFASYCNDIQQMTDYYINIFLHSALGDEAHIIVERLKNCIIMNSKQKWYLKHLNDLFVPKIEDFYSNCSNEEIIDSFIDIIKTIIDDSNIQLENNKTYSQTINETVIEEEEYLEDIKIINNDPKENDKEIVFKIDTELLLLLYNFANMTLKYSSSIKQWRQYKSIFNIPYYLLKKCNLGILSKDAFHINELDKDQKIIILDQNNENENITDQIDISSWSTIVTDIIISFYKENNSEVVLENVDFSKALKICQHTCPVGVESPIMDYYSKIILSKANIISFFAFALKTKQTKFDVESGFTYFYNDNFSSADNKYFIQYTKNVLSLTDFNAKFYMFDREHHLSMNDILNMLTKQINEKENLKLRNNLVNNYNSYVLPFLTSDFSIFMRESTAQLTLDLFPTLVSIEEIGRSYRSLSKNRKLQPPNDKQLEELKIMWNQLFEQIVLILNDPTKCLNNFESKKDIKMNDFLYLQFFYVLKWIKMFIQLSDQKEYEVFMKLFNSLKSLEIQNNTNLPVLADIITSYPTEYWVNESFFIIKESIINLNVSLNNKHFQQVLNIIMKLPNEKIDEIFNDDQCLEILINFFKIQSYIASYDTFPFIKNYLQRNPNKIDRFCIIFDEDCFDPENYHENMNCILNIPDLIIPQNIAFSTLENIIRILSHRNLSYYECRHTFEILASLKNHVLSNEENFATYFDFEKIDIDTLSNLVEMLKSISYSSFQIDELIEMLCINQNIRNDVYSIIHENMSRRFQYVSSFQNLLNFYLRIISQHKDDLKDEIKFISSGLIKSIEDKSPNNFLSSKIYDIVIDANDKDSMKGILTAILKKINVIRHFNVSFEPFVIGMIQLIGIDDIKMVVTDFCNSVNNEDINEDALELYQYNLTVVIEIFPEILQLIKDQYPSMIPKNPSYINSRIQRAFYPNDE